MSFFLKRLVSCTHTDNWFNTKTHRHSVKHSSTTMATCSACRAHIELADSIDQLQAGLQGDHTLRRCRSLHPHVHGPHSPLPHAAYTQNHICTESRPAARSVTCASVARFDLPNAAHTCPCMHMLICCAFRDMRMVQLI